MRNKRSRKRPKVDILYSRESGLDTLILGAWINYSHRIKQGHSDGTCMFM